LSAQEATLTEPTPQTPTVNAAVAAAGLTVVCTRSSELVTAFDEVRSETKALASVCDEMQANLSRLAARKLLPSLRDFSVAECRAAGFDDLLTRPNAGFNVAALKAGGFTATALRAGGFDAATLKAGGFDAAALSASGFDLVALKTAGFDLVALRAAGFDLTCLGG
jgi:hypothetical protein